MTIEYVNRLRQFSRNAWLYIIHVIGMDVIHGAWEVLFNLYLFVVLASLGWTLAQVISFLGLRLAIGFVAGAISAVPAGFISDRLGRKWGFIIGDGVGAAVALVLVTVPNPTLILALAPLDFFLGTLHMVTETPFMADNSQPGERVHLFSFAGGIRTLAAFGGALLAGYLGGLYPLTDPNTLAFMRLALYVGIGGWFASLIPAFFIRKLADEGRRGKRFFIKNPRNVAGIVLVDGALYAGYALTIPFANLYATHAGHAHVQQVGTIFAIGYIALALVTFAAPLLSRRLSKVEAIFLTRALSLPFILLLGFAVQLGGPVGAILLIWSIGYVGRIAVVNAAGPLWDAFSMEILDPAERGTAVGIDTAVGRGVAALGAFVGTGIMATGDLTTPWILMALAYGASGALVLFTFHGREARAPAPAPAAVEA